MSPSPFFFFFFFFYFLFQLQAVPLLSAAATPATCQTRCGNITIPYPFGIGQPGCFRPGFNLTCNQSSTSGSKLYLGEGTFEATNILLAEGQVLINSQVQTLYCGSGDSANDSQVFMWRGLGENGPYTFSGSRNSFVTIGCRAISSIIPFNRQAPSPPTLCAAVCLDLAGVMKNNDSCSGIGCCQTSIGSAQMLYVEISSVTIPQRLSNAKPCTKAFLVDRQWFKFDPVQLQDPNFYGADAKVPVVLDWAIPWDSSDNATWTCAYAVKNQSTYACRSERSDCVSSASGYRCRCSAGFEGNPYISNGCQDIDECALDRNPCSNALCVNNLGNYSCHCPKGTHSTIDGDPRFGCSPDKSQISVGIIIAIGTGAGLGVLILIAAGLLLYKRFQHINAEKHKEKCFRRNHGMLLQQLLATVENDVERTKIFTLDELKKATNNFDATRVLGRGGHGTVYKGILSDQRVVAIKKSEIVNQSEIKQFINEVAILSQINHRNVVKLFGCCLESEVPLLVYEFISGGTLSDHLHVDGNNVPSLSFDDRLRIATEMAGALAYLHSAASISIFHRDIKSSNILLDHNFTAKVSDFGASRSIPGDKTRVTTMIQGTFGYLDPEYYHTGQLTEKSDVYSFGVILIELLTGEKAISHRREEANLAMHFICSFKENRLFDILDIRVAEEGRREQLEAVARLAETCLSIKGEDRPTMKRVEQELDRISKTKYQKRDGSESQKRKPVSRQERCEESASFTANLPSGSSSAANGTRLYSLEKEFMMSMNYPR